MDVYDQMIAAANKALIEESPHPATIIHALLIN